MSARFARAPRGVTPRKLSAIALRLGTRGSALALAQARTVAEQLGGAEIVPIRTSGDERTYDVAEDKSRFVREIEQALLDDDIDLAVHSAKDLPTELPAGLEILFVPRREDPADAFIGGSESLGDLPEAARIGTSSLRRRSQLLAARPDLRLVELRGNVDTRLQRLAAGEFDGIVLAAAGLQRLERSAEIAFRFDSDEMVPAAGQGTLAIEARVGDSGAAAATRGLGDADAEAELAAERALIASLDASCHTPVGARARRIGAGLVLEAYVGLPDGSEWVRDRLEGELADPAGLGRQVAGRLASAGAVELLLRAERAAA